MTPESFACPGGLPSPTVSFPVFLLLNGDLQEFSCFGSSHQEGTVGGTVCSFYNRPAVKFLQCGRYDRRFLEVVSVLPEARTVHAFICPTEIPVSLPCSDPLHPHDHWMRRALDEAVEAFEQDEVPVGAVVVHRDEVIAEAHNQREALNDPTAHAEMIAITQAAEALGSWRLCDCTLYVTLEPCPMCAGAIVQARIPFVVYGTADPKAGACDSLFHITGDIRLNHQAAVLGGVMQDDCRDILQEFFRKQRALGKK